MDWFRAIDIYCERMGPEFWAEPINAISNAAFVIAGLFAFRAARRNNSDMWVQGLCLWVAVIGIGSFLFHTFANAWSQQADVIPIQIIIVTLTLFNFRRFAGQGWPVSIVGTAVLVIGLGWLVGLIPKEIHQAFNGSLFYLPAFVILFGFALFFGVQGKPVAKWLFAAGCIFCVSLFFRSVDMSVCEAFPQGTHFLWHCLNATLLFVLCLATVRYGQKQAAVEA